MDVHCGILQDLALNGGLSGCGFRSTFLSWLNLWIRCRFASGLGVVLVGLMQSLHHGAGY